MKIIKELLEGLELRDNPLGHKEIHYNDDPDHPDDPRLAKFVSTKYPGFVPTNGSENLVAGLGTGTFEEELEMKRAMAASPGALQHRLPSFFGFVWEPGPTKDSRTGKPMSLAQFTNSDKKGKMKLTDEDKKNILKYSEDFGHAVKDKSEILKFDPESKKRLMVKGSQNIIHQLHTNPKFKLENPETYDQVIVIPMHSRSPLSNQFATILTKELKNKGMPNVTLAGNFAKKGKSPKFSSIRSFTQLAVTQRQNRANRVSKISEAIQKHKGSTYPGKPVGYEFKHKKKEDLTNKIWNLPLKLKNKSEDEIRQDFNNHFEEAKQNLAYVNSEIKQLESDIRNLNRITNQQQKEKEKVKLSAEKSRLESAAEAFQKLIDTEKGYRSTMENRIRLAKKKGWSGKAETDNVPSIASDFSTTRHQTRDFANYDENHPIAGSIADKTKRTLVILTDDNVDTGATTDDFYRKMFKNGLIHRNVDVVVAALFKKAQSGRDTNTGFGKSLISQREQHEKLISGGKAKSSPRQRKPPSQKAQPTAQPEVAKQNEPIVQKRSHITPDGSKPLGTLDQALRYAHEEIDAGAITGSRFNPLSDEVKELAMDIVNSENVPYDIAIKAIKQAMTGVSESFIEFLTR